MVFDISFWHPRLGPSLFPPFNHECWAGGGGSPGGGGAPLLALPVPSHCGAALRASAAALFRSILACCSAVNIFNVKRPAQKGLGSDNLRVRHNLGGRGRAHRRGCPGP